MFNLINSKIIKIFNLINYRVKNDKNFSGLFGWFRDLRHRKDEIPLRTNVCYQSEGKSHNKRRKYNSDWRRHSISGRQVTPPPTRRR